MSIKLINRFSQFGKLTAGIVIFGITSVQASVLEGWDISGSNTLKIEHYGSDSTSNGVGTPFAFQNGQFYDDFNLSFQL